MGKFSLQCKGEIEVLSNKIQPWWTREFFDYFLQLDIVSTVRKKDLSVSVLQNGNSCLYISHFKIWGLIFRWRTNIRTWTESTYPCEFHWWRVRSSSVLLYQQLFLFSFSKGSVILNDGCDSPFNHNFKNGNKTAHFIVQILLLFASSAKLYNYYITFAPHRRSNSLRNLITLTAYSP